MQKKTLANASFVASIIQQSSHNNIGLICDHNMNITNAILFKIHIFYTEKTDNHPKME